MKILYVITKSNWGGAQRYVYDLATTFSGKGVDCLVAFGGNGELSSRLRDAGIRTRTIQSLTKNISFIKEFFVLFEMCALIAQEKPTILHLNSSKASGIGVILGRLLGIKNIIVTMHGAPFREDRHFIFGRLIYFFTWVTCLCAHKIIAVSKQDEADIGAMWFIKKKVRTIYLGVTYEPVLARTVPKSKEVRIVTVGELTRNKGYQYGLEAIEKLKRKGILFSYTIIGDGEDRTSIEQHVVLKQLEDVVILAGYQDARSVLQDYDIFLLSSVKEGLPFVLLEAGKVSLPVVATITGGIPEIIRHEETGLLVPVKDSDGIASALERVIRDRKYGKLLGQKLHSHIVQNFSFSKMIVETAKVYGFVSK